MEYSKPMVTIELAEYEQLKRLENESNPNVFKINDILKISYGERTILGVHALSVLTDDCHISKIIEEDGFIRYYIDGKKSAFVITKKA